MPKSIAHSRPTLSSYDQHAVEQVLTSTHLSQGPRVDEFERKFSRYLGVKDAVAVSSGTAALHLSLLALGIKSGDEVIIPSYVCTALLNAVLYCGARPCLVDVNLDDMNISVVDLKRRINRRTKAVIVPHMFGMPADIKALLKLGVPVIEDCAHSIGAEYDGKKVGTFGAVSVCSFYATKVMTTGEGGMVFSNNSKLLDFVRDVRSYDHPAHYQLRFNYKLTDIQAALGLTQLKQLDQFIARRRRIAVRYDETFRHLDVQRPFAFENRKSIFYRYVLRLNGSSSTLVRRLTDGGVNAARPVFRPIHTYLKKSGFKNTDYLCQRCISIPIYPSMTAGEVDRVSSLVSSCLSK